MFAVKLVNFSMFAVSGENTVKCLKGFSWKPHSLLALLKSPMNFEPVLKGAVAVVSFCTHAQQHSGRPGEYWVPISCQGPTIVGKRRGRSRNIIAAMAASSGFSSNVVKVLVSFYRSREDSAFEKRRSRVTFNVSKQSSVVAVKKHLREFPGLDELALKFDSADFELRLFRLQRSSNEKTENYIIVTQ